MSDVGDESVVNKSLPHPDYVLESERHKERLSKIVDDIESGFAAYGRLMPDTVVVGPISQCRKEVNGLFGVDAFLCSVPDWAKDPSGLDDEQSRVPRPELYNMSRAHYAARTRAIICAEEEAERRGYTLEQWHDVVRLVSMSDRTADYDAMIDIIDRKFKEELGTVYLKGGLVLYGDGGKFVSLGSVSVGWTYLYFKNFSSIESFGDCINICIEDSPDLTEIPGERLEHLNIRDCPGITSFPESFAVGWVRLNGNVSEELKEDARGLRNGFGTSRYIKNLAIDDYAVGPWDDTYAFLG